MDNAHDNLVTIARFENHAEFMVARAQLESAGIEVLARNENAIVWTAPFSAMFGAYVELQVRESDAEDALAMLNSESPLPEADGE
jgi:hypothetical protein